MNVRIPLWLRWASGEKNPESRYEERLGQRVESVATVGRTFVRSSQATIYHTAVAPIVLLVLRYATRREKPRSRTLSPRVKESEAATNNDDDEEYQRVCNMCLSPALLSPPPLFLLLPVSLFSLFLFFLFLSHHFIMLFFRADYVAAWESRCKENIWKSHR